jgi:hypothetical protein
MAMSRRSVRSVIRLGVLFAFVLLPTALYAQQSPWERAALNLEATFTGPLARSLLERRGALSESFHVTEILRREQLFFQRANKNVRCTRLTRAAGRAAVVARRLLASSGVVCVNRNGREPMTRDVDQKSLPVGKLPLEHLRSLLGHLPRHDPRLLIGPQIGEDAAVIDVGDRYLVVSTDPITCATDHIGRYAVHVNANDLAVLGARPRARAVETHRVGCVANCRRG